MLLGLPEIKPLLKNRKQLVTAVKTKSCAEASSSKNEATCPIRSGSQQASKKNKNILNNNWSEKEFGGEWGYGVTHVSLPTIAKET